MLDTKFENIEEGFEKLKDAARIRNKMGGALYWNVCNDDCIAIAEDLISIGADRSKVVDILN